MFQVEIKIEVLFIIKLKRNTTTPVNLNRN